MNVDHLFIVTLTYNGQLNQIEIVEDAKALYARYSKGGAKAGQAKTVRIVELHSKAIVEAKIENQIVVWKDGDYETEINQTFKGPRTNETVGVYVIGHGGGGKMTIPPEEIAELLRTLAGQGRLSKVVLLVCEVGIGIDSKAEIEWDTEHHDVAIKGVDKEDLCDASGAYIISTLLSDKAGNSPMVAGWDDFVSVCYGGMSKAHQPREIRENYKIGEKGKMNDKGLREALSTTYLGRKTFEDNNKKVLPDAQTREAHKVIYVAKEGIVYRRHPAAWTDKGTVTKTMRATNNNNNNNVGKEERFNG